MYSYLLLPKNSFKNVMRLKAQHRKVDSENIQVRRRHQSRDINWPDDYFPATGDDRNQESRQAAWATFHRYRPELTSKTFMLGHRLWLFDAVVSPTMNYASGTWTLRNEHERMIQSTQRKMLRLIMQTKRRYKKIEKRKDKTNENDDPENLGSTEDENEDGQSSNTCYDQDSDISFKNDRHNSD